MASAERLVQELVFEFAEDADTSQAMNASAGVMGTIIVPTGSALIGKELQFVAHSPDALYADTELLTTPKTLVAGNNVLTDDEILEVSFVNVLKLKVNSAVDADSSCVLLWKS